MDKLVYYNNLYDIYSSLLTENEQTTFEDYYQEDLSLSEIATNNNVSRSAVQKTIKNVTEKLNYYEEKLSIYQKEQKLKEILSMTDLNEIKGTIEELLNSI